MPNGYSHKEYGEHKYSYDGTSDCKHGCGCWMGPTLSGGPTGLDPFGTCPKNPKDGKFLGGTADYDYVVTKRIQILSSCLQKAEDLLRQVSPSKTELANELARRKTELVDKNQLLNDIRLMIEAD